MEFCGSLNHAIAREQGTRNGIPKERMTDRRPRFTNAHDTRIGYLKDEKTERRINQAETRTGVNQVVQRTRLTKTWIFFLKNRAFGLCIVLLVHRFLHKVCLPRWVPGKFPRFCEILLIHQCSYDEFDRHRYITTECQIGHKTDQETSPERGLCRVQKRTFIRTHKTRIGRLTDIQMECWMNQSEEQKMDSEMTF